MVVRFGRSAVNHNQSIHYYFALSMNMLHYYIFLEVHLYQVQWIVMMEDLQINHFIRIHSILSIIVDKG